ncbi:hypothetical protein BU26DRAFT_499814 [Trematosphaeria pertusa]|uniref:Uncharacterized protein n=1 Tax=Trematosphaeria pertusa TaxID=390896 RepID=A0A6A6J376_9PLEO|nr:uncharacterized protein BU26DRAFT_499814 [Trematosphaeria pertusa]KAF2257295.1 hypothetical protein BU26DRAFT_499814 [Trematosphaeria pertusa]
MLLRSNTLLPCQQGLTVWLCPDRGTGEPVAIKTDGIATYGYIKKDDINLMGMGSHGWPSGRINSTSPSGARFRVYASTREVNHLFIQGPRLSSETASPLAYRLADRSHLFTPEVRRHTVAQVAQVALSAESHPALRSPPHVCDRDRNRNRQPDSKFALLGPGENKKQHSLLQLSLFPLSTPASPAEDHEKANRKARPPGSPVSGCEAHAPVRPLRSRGARGCIRKGIGKCDVGVLCAAAAAI